MNSKITDMKAEIKKYLRKRKQIIDIIMQMDVHCQDKVDRMLYDYTVKPQFWESRDTAEKILAKVGISKPKELEQQLNILAVSVAKRNVCPVCKKTFEKGWGEFCSQDCWDTDM